MIEQDGPNAFHVRGCSPFPYEQKNVAEAGGGTTSEKPRGAVRIEFPLHPPTKLGREDVEILMDGQKVTVESTVSLVPGQNQVVRDYLIYPRIEDNARYIRERDAAAESHDETALPPGRYTHNRTEIIDGEGTDP